MRYGFTTGSCAAAAAKAAAYMLLTGKKKENISILTPKGIVFEAKLLEITRKEGSVSCAVEKDGGDDPDITTGVLVYAEVSYAECSQPLKTVSPLREKTQKEKQKETRKETQKETQRETQENASWPETSKAFHATVEIDGGIGVGRVTRPGMDQPVGNAAINHVPRQMIESEVLEVCRMADYKGGLKVIISIPKGVELAEKTFNPKLGIVGGISVLGTSGVVEPMSSQALLDTIRLELTMQRAQNSPIAAVSPGNYGLDFMKETYGYDLDASVKCSNFIGETIDMAVECGFEKMLLTGHIGKLVKVSGGIMNTHSREADCRVELLAAAGLRAGVSHTNLMKILDSATTTEAIAYLEEENKTKPVMDYLMERIFYYTNRRAGGKMQIECILYDNQYGELAKSEKAEEFLNELKNHRAAIK